MELELRHLRVVLAITESGTLTAAGTALGMTQPSVTDALQRIERAVGGPLFHRGARRTVPTPLGELVAGHARTVLDRLDRLGTAVARHRSGSLPSTVRFGCTPSALLASLSLIVPKLWGTGVEVLTELDERTPLDLLAERRVEAAVLVDFPGHEPVVPPGAGRLAIAVEPLFVAVADRHRLAGKTEADLADLAGETWGRADPSETGFTEHLLLACARVGYTPDIRDMKYVEAFQLAELGSAVLPIMPSARPRTGLEFIPLAGVPMRMTTRLYWNLDGPLSRADVEALWAELVEAQHAFAERTPVYQAWLDRHPEWSTTPARPSPDHDPLA